MEILPYDILRHIFSFLPQTTLVHCRLLSRASGALATALAFRQVRLETFCDCLPYIRISESAYLRTLVREVTLDVGQMLLPHEENVQTIARHHGFLVALPQLRVFTGLQALNIKFAPANVTLLLPDVRAELHATSGRRYHYFQTMVLSTILECITGQWSEGHHREWETHWIPRCTSRVTGGTRASTLAVDSSASPDPATKSTDVLFPFSPSSALTSLATLTISNLPDAIEHELYTSPPFQAFASSHPLCALKILVSTEQNMRRPAESIFIPTKYDFFERLPTTWLSTSLTSNLRVLSLFCDHYFGWAPKLDLRMIRPGPAFPRLKVLALGNYVFTHDWQVEWIASLGANNGRGGLEELYLDDCPIMWRARTRGLMDSSTLNVDGMQINNSGYPLKEAMTSREAQHHDPVTVDFGLRWSSVLQTWRHEMKALKVFKMGSGDWEEAHSAMVTTARTMDLPSGDFTYGQEARGIWKRRSENMIHLNYDKPSLAECLTRQSPDWAVMRDGIGMNQRREHVLQYVQFDVGMGPTPWMERDFRRDMLDHTYCGRQQYEAVRSADEAAWRDISGAVSSRLRN